MATLSETMTLAGFSARVTAGTLNIGQIYTISDKGWVLQAHSNTIAKPLHGALKITNGDNLPEGVAADEIIIDTDFSTDTDTTVSLIVPNNYYPISAVVVDMQGMDDVVSINYDDINTVLGAELELTPKTKIMYSRSVSYQYILNNPLTITLPSGLVGRISIRFVKFI